VKLFWQKNAWVDSIVMQELAKRFVDYKNKKFGEDQWVINLLIRIRIQNRIKNNNNLPD